MARYIDADVLMGKLSRMVDYCQKDNKVNGLTALFQVGDAIIDTPTADVVEVVRCKDCKHKVNYCGRIMCGRLMYRLSGGVGGLTATTSKNFCSYGERKEGELK